MTSTSVSQLRDILATLPPTGSNGFEGLLGTALSAFTGLSFRLAKSGRQHGRDGGTTPGGFGILFEAKRYSGEPPGTDELLGKLSAAINQSAGNLDLWILGATVAIDNLAVEELTLTADRSGIAVLVLDWPEGLLPPLAALHANTAAETTAWFQANATPERADEIAELLRQITAHPDFTRATSELRTACARPTSGFDAARSANGKWLAEQFAERMRSKRTFGQFLSPGDRTRPYVERQQQVAALTVLLTQPAAHDQLYLVTGEEGAGKTWLVAAAWQNQPEPRPLLLLNTSRSLPSSGERQNPLQLLARLCCEQTGQPLLEANVARWERKLTNWAEHGGSDPIPRMWLVLDGLNERESYRWDELIDGLSDLAARIGMRVILTSRRAYYERRLAPRLAGFDIHVHDVPNFSDAELDEALRALGANPGDIPDAVREFIRNPRIFSIAVEILGKLDPRRLTKERLFLQYWKHRLREKGGALQHSDHELKQLLQSHASRLRESIQGSAGRRQLAFDRYQLRSHSRLSGIPDTSIHDELVEIETGSFFSPSPDQEGHYEFRPDAAAFSLGLLLVDELKTWAREHPDDPMVEFAATLVEPLHGFDLLADVLVAALGIASLDSGCRDDIVSALICATLNSQNLPDTAIDAFCSYAIERLPAYLRGAELLHSKAHSSRYHSDWLEEALVRARQAKGTEVALDAAINKWLTTWTTDHADARRGEAPEAVEKRKAVVMDRVSQLTEAERTFLAEHGNEVDDYLMPTLDRLAIRLLVGRPLAPFANALLVWAMGSQIMRQPHRAIDQLPWLIRLNRVDFNAAVSNIANACDRLFAAGVSNVGHGAIYRLLFMSGRPQDSARANELWLSWPERILYDVGARREHHVDTDPLDPASEHPTNLDKVLEGLQAHPPSTIHANFSMTIADHNFSERKPGLARFAPDELASYCRDILASAATRTGMELRQLAWVAPEYSPLCTSVEVDALRAAYRNSLTDSTLKSDNDRRVIPAYLYLALLPHLDGHDQLRSLLDLPADTNELMSFRPFFKPVEPAVLEQELAAAEAAKDPVLLRRVLYFASTGKTQLTPGFREILVRCFNHEDSTTRLIACWTATVADDGSLLAALVDSGWSAEGKDDAEAHYGSRALAIHCSTRHGIDILHRIHPDWHGPIARKLGGQFAEAFAVEMLDSIGAALKALPEADFTIEVLRESHPVTGEPEQFPHYDFSRRTTATDIETKLRELSGTPAEVIRRGDEEWKRDFAALRQFLAKLKENTAPGTIVTPSLQDIKLIQSSFPAVFEKLVQMVESADGWPLSLIHYQALHLAIALSSSDGRRAAALFRKLETVRPSITYTIDGAGLQFQNHAVWLADDAEAVNELRLQRLRSATSDQAIAAEVLGALRAGKEVVLSGMVRQLSASEHPADLALAATIAGFSSDRELADQVLGDDRYRHGFLADCRNAASKAYHRFIWSRHWFDEARLANTPEGYWARSELLLNCVDPRFTLWDMKQESAEPYRTFVSTLEGQLNSRAKSVAKKRAETLYGRRFPSSEFIRLLFPDSGQEGVEHLA